MAEILDLEDIQGILVRGYGNLTAACYVLLTINDLETARSWLISIVDSITTGQNRPEETALNIAFMPAGLKKFGLDAHIIAMFSSEFVEGMVTPHRSRILGDVEESAPEHWLWGNTATPPIDMMLLLFARDDSALKDIYTNYARTFPVHGVQEIKRLDTVNLGSKEHFGFRDGISQPVMSGLQMSEAPMNTIQTGEFLLGYPNEYGLFTERPLIAATKDPQGLLPSDAAGSGKRDFGRNGSYLVFRQLHQDVRGFWQFLDRATQNPDGSSNPTARTWLAAKMVGRWPSGAPLLKTPEKDEPQLANANDFGYYQVDPYGFNCPLGAHIRRAHPRDSLEPQPGSEKSIAVGKRHRLLRRGREYGKPLDPEILFTTPSPEVEDQDRGLHFICFCTNIARQFEFIQHTWLNNSHFHGLYDDTDPITGLHSPNGGTFTIQSHPIRKRVTGLLRFISVRGGAYFFLPGIRAIRYLTT